MFRSKVHLRQLKFLLFLCGIISSPLIAQVYVEKPATSFNLFFKNYKIINPANAEDTKTSFSLGNRSYTGLFKGVTQFYADIDFFLSQKKSNMKGHSLGIWLLANRQGDFFRKNRVYARYAYRNQLSQDFSLSLGVSAGLVNYVFSSSDASTGGSDSDFDGSLGMWFLYKKLKVGASLQQLTNTILRPVNQPFYLKRYMSVMASHSWPISPSLTWETHGNVSFIPLFGTLMQMAGLVQIHEAEFGAGYKSDAGVSVFAGLRELRLQQYAVSFSASYMFSRVVIKKVNNNILELNLSISKH